jgi:acyl carrier protein
MHDPALNLTAILRKYMRDPSRPVHSAVALTDLGIDRLDVPLICLDIEDAFDVSIGLGEDLDELVTAGDIAARLAGALAARSAPRALLARRKSSWMSTGADRRR